MQTKLGAVPEYVLIAAFWGLCRMLPATQASRFGRVLFESAGPRLGKHRHVRRNLAQALGRGAPDAVLHRAAREVWGNLGAVMAEYPHLGRIVAERLEVTMSPGARALRGTPSVFLSGHLANWELAAAAIAREWGPVSVVYSEQDNPLIDAALQRLRGALGVGFVEKDSALRPLIAAFAAGRSLGLLPDQRIDSGSEVPLCGLPAPTTVSPSRLALRFGCPLIPIWVERIGAVRYRVVFDAPIEAPPGLPRREAANRLMATFNERLGERIRAHPGDWLCTKRRWPKLVTPVASQPPLQRTAA